MLSAKTICVIEAHSSANAVVYGATLDHPILWLALDVPSKSPSDVILHQPTARAENGKVSLDDVAQLLSKRLNV